MGHSCLAPPQRGLLSNHHPPGSLYFGVCPPWLSPPAFPGSSWSCVLGGQCHLPSTLAHPDLLRISPTQPEGSQEQSVKEASGLGSDYPHQGPPWSQCHSPSPKQITQPHATHSPGQGESSQCFICRIFLSLDLPYASSQIRSYLAISSCNQGKDID